MLKTSDVTPFLKRLSKRCFWQGRQEQAEDLLFGVFRNFVNLHNLEHAVYKRVCRSVLIANFRDLREPLDWRFCDRLTVFVYAGPGCNLIGSFQSFDEPLTLNFRFKGTDEKICLPQFGTTLGFIRNPEVTVTGQREVRIETALSRQLCEYFSTNLFSKISIVGC